MELRTDYSDVHFQDNGKIKLLIIVGTRPEIIRLAAIINKSRKYLDVILAHTGQNYDYNLNGVFFHDLKLKDPEVYISSADLMTRNLERRVEVGAPIHDPRIKKTILNMFDIMLHDNVKASRLLNDGTYKRVKNKQEKINSQEYFFKKKV